MKIPAMIGGLLVTLWVGGPAIAADKPVAVAVAVAVAETCAASGELNFLCGLKKPEDLVVLPGGRWIVASGMSTRSGLHLIDRQTKKWARWIAPVAAAPRARFANCPSQSPSDELQLHGISLRDRGRGHATLYAVNHGGGEDVHNMAVGGDRETIEIFDIDMSSAKPTLSWAGCVPLPAKLVANSVVSAPDGSLFATVFLHPDRSVADLWKGIPTGAVYKWTPGAAAFQRMAGTELTGNNGIELSPDGKTLYVSSIGAITAFTNTNLAKRLESVEVKGVIPDNLHWVNGRLIVAGARTDTCPKTAEVQPCIAGYFVSIVHPKTLTLTTLAMGDANPAFNGVSVALPVGNTLWLGSYSDNKIAYRTLP